MYEIIAKHPSRKMDLEILMEAPKFRSSSYSSSFEAKKINETKLKFARRVQVTKKGSRRGSLGTVIDENWEGSGRIKVRLEKCGEEVSYQRDELQALNSELISAIISNISSAASKSVGEIDDEIASSYTLPPSAPPSAPPPAPPAPHLVLRMSTMSLERKFGVSNVRDLVLSTVHIQTWWRGILARAKVALKTKYLSKKKVEMKILQKAFTTDHMTNNYRAVMDWDTRWCRMLYQIYKAGPDILAMTEVDTLAQMQFDLGKLGYECGFPGIKHQPMHAFKDQDTSFGEFLRHSGIAYAPNANSNALAIGISNAICTETVHAAAEKMMGAHSFEHPSGGPKQKTHQKWNMRSLFKDKTFGKKGGTQELFSQMRKIDPKVPPANTFDDDCSVIFWRKSRFSLSQIEYLDMSAKGKYKSAVKATFCDRATGQLVQVMTAHLASGLAVKDCAKRMKELTGKATVIPSSIPDKGAKASAAAEAIMKLRTVKGMYAWWKESCQSGRCILTMDANSRPQFPGEETVWKTFSGANSGGTGADVRAWQSVWDKYFTAQGDPIAGSAPAGKNLPVTVNKMRGSMSQQPQKIGLHAYELIDHIYYSKGVNFLQHALPPKHYKNQASAAMKLIPDLVTPTDHFPVVCDFHLV